MTQLKLLKHWKRFDAGKVLDLPGGVADLLIRKKIAELVGVQCKREEDANAKQQAARRRKRD